MSLESVHPPRLVNLKPLAQSCSLLRRSVSEMSLSNISNEHIFPMKESTSLSDRQLQNIELDVSDSDLNPQNNSKVSCQIPLKKANSLSVIAQEMYAEFSFVKPLMHVSQIDINRDTKSQKLTEVNGNVVNLGKGAPQSVSLVSNSVCELPHFVQRGEFNRVCETLLKLSEHHCQQKSPSRIDWNALGDTLETLAGQQTLLENMIKNAIENAIHVRNRAITIKLLDFACQLHKTQAPDTITDIWPAYQEGSEWDPVFVVLSQQKHPDDQYLGFKRHWRHSDLVSREGCIVAYSDEVRDNPLSFQDMERMRKLIRTADLFNFHSKITLTNACPCRSRNGGRDISVEMCIVIYTSVKGFIPFDEQPFPKTVFGIPVDVREGYVTLGGKWQAPLYVDCEREFSYTTKNQIKNSSTLLNYENGTTDMDHNHSLSPHMHGQKLLLQIQRRKEPYSIFKPTNQIKRNGTNAVTKSSEKLSTSVNELRELKNCVYNSQHRFPPDGQEAPTNSNGLTNPTSNQFQLTSNDSNVNHFVIKTKHMTDLLIKNNDQQSPETAATISLNNVCKSISHSDCNTRHTPEDLVSLSNKFSGQCCISVSEINDNVSTPKPLPFNFASDANILTIAASDIKGNAVTNQSSKEPVKTIFNQQFFQINDVTAPSAVSNNENTVAGSSMETNKVSRFTCNLGHSYYKSGRTAVENRCNLNNGYQ